MSSQNVSARAKLEQRALACLARNDLSGAEVWIEKMLDADEADAVALALMSDIYKQRGEFSNALGLLAMAIDNKPDEKGWLQSFVSCANRASFSFSEYNDLIFRALGVCIARDDIDCTPLWQMWLSLLGMHPDLRVLLSPSASFADEKNAALAAHPFFVDGLRNLVVPDMAFEKRVIDLRAALLGALAGGSGTAPWNRDDFLRLAGALARYACITEYIFDATDEETARLDVMRQSFEKSPDSARAEDLAVFACYELLGDLPFAPQLLAVCDSVPALCPLADLQIRERARLAEIAKSIPVFTSLDKGVSAQVRRQYETFPYPRWSYLPPFVNADIQERDLSPQGRWLVAGCGTGYEAALAGLMMPGVNIDAMDLSRASLSYAIARAQDLGLQNITFAQGDILRLADRDDRYDYILSAGVLHHMSDLLAGWKVLRSILKPKGLMRIALYSEYGRQDIVAARAVIKEKGFAATRKGMKDFRRQMSALLPADVCERLCKRGDFYQMSMLCDLLFHVKEHRVGLPQIVEMLSELELEFAGFDLPSGALTAFYDMHGPGADDKDLAKWDALEQSRPDTFRAMYQFWCRATG